LPKLEVPLAIHKRRKKDVSISYPSPKGNTSFLVAARCKTAAVQGFEQAVEVGITKGHGIGRKDLESRGSVLRGREKKPGGQHTHFGG
jgi:hypothetical protein